MERKVCGKVVKVNQPGQNLEADCEKNRHQDLEIANNVPDLLLVPKPEYHRVQKVSNEHRKCGG
jgi:hypothetical protein